MKRNLAQLKELKDELLDQNEKSIKHIKTLTISLKEYFSNNDYKHYEGTLRIVNTYRGIVVKNNHTLSKIDYKLNKATRGEKLGGGTIY